MAVELDLDNEHHVALLVVRGGLTPRTAPAVTGAIAGLVTNDGYDVVVDLTESEALLPWSVRALRRGRDVADAHHRTVRVACPPSSPVRPALVLAHLDDRVYDSRDAALATSGSSAASPRPTAR